VHLSSPLRVGSGWALYGGFFDSCKWGFAAGYRGVIASRGSATGKGCVKRLSIHWPRSYFFTTVAAFSDLYIAGMAPGEVFFTRLIMVPMMIVAVRPYGIYRDWMFAKTIPTVGWSRTLMDVVAFLTFQLPVYAVTLIVSGASFVQIATLLLMTAVLMVFLSRPFGLYLERVRGWFGVAEV
jgi:hypothetical protein